MYAVLQSGLDTPLMWRAMGKEANASAWSGKKEWEAERKRGDLTGKLPERRKITLGREKTVFLFLLHTQCQRIVLKAMMAYLDKSKW